MNQKVKVAIWQIYALDIVKALFLAILGTTARLPEKSKLQ